MEIPVKDEERGVIAARLALALSAAMTPALTATAALALITWRFESGWRAAGFFALTLLFGSAFGTVLAVVRARWKGLADVHIAERRDRPAFFAACAGVAAVGWAVLALVGAPLPLLVLMAAYGACLGAIALTTLVTKPSVHCAAMAALAGALLIVRPVFVPVAVAGLAALTWARLYRRRHTLWECLLGTAIGAATVAAAYLALKLLT